MEERVKKVEQEQENEEIKQAEGYNIYTSSGTTLNALKDIDIPSYPSPRTYDKEYLKSRKEAAELMPVYKEKIVNNIRKKQERIKGVKLSEREIQDLEDKIIVIQEGKADALLSTLSHTSSGVMMDRVLRFIPELLYRENSKLKTLSEGTAYRAISPKENTQLSLFKESEEGSEKQNSECAILKYNSREWAKMIYNKSNPLPKEEGFIERVIEQLSQTKIYYPLSESRFAYAPLIWRSNTGVINTDEEGLSFEYIRLHPLFTLSLTKEIVWHTSIKQIGSLSKQIELRLLDRLELLYSYANTNIEAKAKKGETEEHRENKEKLLSVVLTADAASFKKNKSRYLKVLLTAFARMEEIGIIEKGSFKEERDNYVWRWTPYFFRRGKHL